MKGFEIATFVWYPASFRGDWITPVLLLSLLIAAGLNVPRFPAFQAVDEISANVANNYGWVAAMILVNFLILLRKARLRYWNDLHALFPTLVSLALLSAICYVVCIVLLPNISNTSVPAKLFIAQGGLAGFLFLAQGMLEDDVDFRRLNRLRKKASKLLRLIQDSTDQVNDLREQAKDALTLLDSACTSALRNGVATDSQRALIKKLASQVKEARSELDKIGNDRLPSALKKANLAILKSGFNK